MLFSLTMPLLALICCYLNEAFYRKTRIISATQLRENEEATVSPLTKVRGRHHGCTLVLAGTIILLFYYSMGITSHGHPGGVKICLNEAKLQIIIIQISVKRIKQALPSINRE